MTEITNQDLATQIETFVASVTVRDELFYEWQVGTATGGPNNDGYYPLTDYAGNTRLIASPEKIQTLAIYNISGGILNFNSWAELAAYDTTALSNNYGAKVYNDAGTHTDPVTSTASTPNKGVYKLVKPTGWERIANLEAEDVVSAVQVLKDSVTASEANVVGLVDTSDSANSLVHLFIDEVGNVPVWLNNGLLEASGLGPTLMAYISANSAGSDTLVKTPIHTNGTHFVKFKARLTNLLLGSSTKRTAKAHLWMMGDSWTERAMIPDAFRSDLLAYGIDTVATGWIGPQSTGTSALTGSNKLLGDARLTIAGSSYTVTDINFEATAVGQYSPEGFRITFLEGTTDNTFTIYWKGKTLDLYFTLNGASFSVQTDSGTIAAQTLANTGLPGKITVTPTSGEGWHTTIVTRPSALGDLIWFGGFARSDLVGLTISKCGNGGATTAHIASVINSTTSAYILNDVDPDTIRLCFLTNDSRLSDNTTTFSASLNTVIDAYRTANPACEILFAIPPANGVSGLTAGFDIGTYVSTVFSIADTKSIEVYDYYTDWPKYADCLFYWFDTLHLEILGGGAEYMARAERRAFWEIK